MNIDVWVCWFDWLFCAWTKIYSTQSWAKWMTSLWQMEYPCMFIVSIESTMFCERLLLVYIITICQMWRGSLGEQKHRAIELRTNHFSLLYIFIHIIHSFYFFALFLLLPHRVSFHVKCQLSTCVCAILKTLINFSALIHTLVNLMDILDI